MDTLFFDFIDLAKKLQPKIVIAENVKGILLGEAKEYVKKILTDFDKAGYIVKEFLLNAMRMGVPQKRERVFFIAIRKDLVEFLPSNDAIIFDDFPLLNLVFFEPLIKFGKIKDSNYVDEDAEMTDVKRNIWNKREFGDLDFSCTLGRTENRPNSMFNNNYIYDDKVLNTITSKKNDVLMSEPRHCNFIENMRGSTFPMDYDFLGMPYRYLLGMSVPPVMTAQIASRIYEQWLSKIQ